jgi:hypothetical protein
MRDSLVQPIHSGDPSNRHRLSPRAAKEQWAGLFRDLLVRQSSQHQIASLASQVGELAEVNKTLKKYLEEVVSKVNPEEAAGLIATESKRLEEARKMAAIAENELGQLLIEDYEIPNERIREMLETARSPLEFAQKVSQLVKGEASDKWKELYSRNMSPLTRDVNKMRAALNLPPLVRQIGRSVRASQFSDTHPSSDESDD